MNIQEMLEGVTNCPCGMKHSCDIKAVEIGDGVLEKLSEICVPFHSIVLVADGNTYPLCGEKVKSILRGKIIGECIYGKETVIPDEKAIAKIEGAMLADCDLLLGIGSGVIQDLCKYVSFFHDIRYVIVATAPSMDGYASVGAAMILNQMKVTVGARVPYAIVAESDVVRTAPMDMIRSGYGDIVGKYSCLNDWKIAHLLRKEYFCQFVYDTVWNTVKSVENTAEALLKRDREAVRNLTEALVVVGVMMSYVGNSRPASGSEHHLSHFFEITGILDRHDYYLHGIDVLYSAVVTTALREKLLNMKPPFINAIEPETKRNANIQKIYTSASEGVIALQKKVGLYAEADVNLFAEHWNEICALLREVPSKKQMEGYVNAIGLKMDDFYKFYGKDRIKNAIRYAKDLKDRYTVLWICYLLGVTEWN